MYLNIFFIPAHAYSNKQTKTKKNPKIKEIAAYKKKRILPNVA